MHRKGSSGRTTNFALVSPSALLQRTRLHLAAQFVSGRLTLNVPESATATLTSPASKAVSKPPSGSLSLISAVTLAWPFARLVLVSGRVATRLGTIGVKEPPHDPLLQVQSPPPAAAR